MRATSFIHPALAAAVAACLVLPVSEPRAAQQVAPVAFRPNVALAASTVTLLPPVALVYSQTAIRRPHR